MKTITKFILLSIIALVLCLGLVSGFLFFKISSPSSPSSPQTSFESRFRESRD